MAIMQVTINYLGIPLSVDQIENLLERPTASAQTEWQGTIIEQFFGLPLKALPTETLKRYCETSSSELYAPVMPHSIKLFERLISPLKSAKRCYCFGDYLATIELSAHVGEMLTQLTWKMTPVTHNQNRVTNEFEKRVFGSKFEKLGQQRRLSVLHAFGAITDLQHQLFTYLKNKRRTYFHLWSPGTENIKDDSLDCYKMALTLTREILQISISPEEPGKIIVNPLLINYLRDLGEWKDD